LADLPLQPADPPDVVVWRQDCAAPPDAEAASPDSSSLRRAQARS
jgi:hypothetical protein